MKFGTRDQVRTSFTDFPKKVFISDNSQYKSITCVKSIIVFTRNLSQSQQQNAVMLAPPGESKYTDTQRDSF